MDHHQTKKIRMIRASFAVVRDHPGIWTGNTAVEQTMRVIGDHLTEMERVIQVQALKSEVTTRQKNQVEMHLMTETLANCGLLWSIADTAGTEGLKALAEVTKTDLKNKRGEHLEGFCGQIAGALRTHETVLAALGLTPADIIAYQDLITSYRTHLSQVRTVICERAAATAMIVQLNQRLTQLFRYQLDKMLVKYEDSHSEFYQAYRNARKMVNKRTAKKKAEQTPLPNPLQEQTTSPGHYASLVLTASPQHLITMPKPPFSGFQRYPKPPDI